MATNYERITESSEKLAKFLACISKRCEGMDDTAAVCNECPLVRIDCASQERIVEWLQEECDE